MKSDKWLKVARNLALISLIVIFTSLQQSTNLASIYSDVIQILGLAVSFTTMTGTFSAMYIAWRLDRRQAREAVLKEREYTLKIAELEKKLANLKSDAQQNDSSAGLTETSRGNPTS